MKATDLMIGDWVLYGDKSVRVLQLSENSKYDWVKPIPLTYEILKKNGWKGGAGRNIRFKSPYILAKKNDVWNMYYNEARIAEIRYVHELQNIMRIIGYQGEFKI